jgi:HTH-type transcriptional regulator/antitoxin HigA
MAPSSTEDPMAHLLDPTALPDEAAYAAALNELDDLMLADPGTPGGRRFEELATLIEEYEARRDGYDLARMRRMCESG